jgi:Ala-tRNA(Pro) deacylase
MAIAKTVEQYLQQHRVSYSLIPHGHSASSKKTVLAAHITPSRVAKAVMFVDHGQYVMAVVPADRHVGVETVSRLLGRKLEFATEARFASVFRDCEPGAVPPLGPAYGVETVLDDSLVGQPEIFFEAGDHEELIRVEGEQFVQLLKEARHGRFCH